MSKSHVAQVVPPRFLAGDLRLFPMRTNAAPGRAAQSPKSRAASAIWRLLLLAFAVVWSTGSSLVPLRAAQSDKPPASAKSGEQFFIISSVDSAKKQLLLKEPTEITEVLQVNDKTRYTDRNGKGIQFSDLRAGDTVFIRTGNTPAGKVAVSIRKGPMTVEELHRRYLK